MKPYGNNWLCRNPLNSQNWVLCKADWTMSQAFPPSSRSLPATSSRFTHSSPELCGRNMLLIVCIPVAANKTTLKEQIQALVHLPAARARLISAGCSRSCNYWSHLQLLITRAPPAVRPGSAPQHIPSTSQCILNLDYLHSSSAVPVCTV